VKTGERAVKLKTRVFELSNGRYRNLVELAQTMGISNDLIYRVRRGERGIMDVAELLTGGGFSAVLLC